MFRDRPCAFVHGTDLFGYPANLCLCIYRAAFTILAAGPRQVLFFIDSFDRRAASRTIHVSHEDCFKTVPRRFSSLSGCIVRLRRKKREKYGERRRREGGRGKRGQGGRGDPIEIVPIITHSGVDSRREATRLVIDRKKSYASIMELFPVAS